MVLPNIGVDGSGSFIFGSIVYQIDVIVGVVLSIERAEKTLILLLGKSIECIGKNTQMGLAKDLPYAILVVKIVKLSLCVLAGRRVGVQTFEESLIIHLIFLFVI